MRAKNYYLGAVLWVVEEKIDGKWYFDLSTMCTTSRGAIIQWKDGYGYGSDYMPKEWSRMKKAGEARTIQVVVSTPQTADSKGGNDLDHIPATRKMVEDGRLDSEIDTEDADEGIRVVTHCFGQKFVNGKPVDGEEEEDEN